jgi:hypothetical protein
MSAAATAAGYLYASGRLRGRGAREQEDTARPAKEQRRPARKDVVVAALPEPSERPQTADPNKRAPRIQYRVRRRIPEPHE